MTKEREAPLQYRFAEQVIASCIPLRSLPAEPSRRVEPPIRIVHVQPVPALPAFDSWMFDWAAGDDAVTMRVRQEPVGYRLRMYDMCDLRMDVQAGTVKVEHLPCVDGDAIEHMLIDQALPRLLSERGKLVLHAGAIGVDDRCVLLMGQTGWGKSTLAASFHQQGHALLSDDCVVLHRQDEDFIATPTYRSLRMYEDSMSTTMGVDVESRPLAFYTDKRRIQLADDGAVCARAVDSVYLLNDPVESADAISIVPLPSREGCMAMIKHSFRLDVEAPARLREQLRLASLVAARVPAFALSYPRGYERRDAVVERLREHARSLGR